MSFKRFTSNSPAPNRTFNTGSQSPYVPERIFWNGHARLIDHYTKGSTGMGAVFIITDDLGYMPVPFRGIKAGNASGQRMRIQICTISENDPVPVYDGESVLARWNEDYKGVTFGIRLDDSVDGSPINPFQAYRSDKDDGEIFAIAIWLIDDDETVSTKRPKRAFNELGAAQQSQILCKTDPNFQEWSIYHVGPKFDIHPTAEETPAETSARIVRAWCGVESRAEFSRPEGQIARERWFDMLHQFRTRYRD